MLLHSDSVVLVGVLLEECHSNELNIKMYLVYPTVLGKGIFVNILSMHVLQMS